MSQEDFNGSSEQPISDTPEIEPLMDDVATPVEPVTPIHKEEPSKPKPPSKANRFFRKVMLYLIGILSVFLVGFITAWYFKVVPLNQALEDVRAEVATDVASLEAQIADDEIRFHLMNALVDVYSARVALAAEDTPGVRVALAGTDERLGLVEDSVIEDSADAVASLRERLDAVLQTVEEDPAAADRILERLASNLLTLERSLFGE